MNSEWAEQPEKKSSQATPGAQLQAQREAMGLSVEQIADQLKLAPRQVAALEAGDYAALPNMAVTRGFVRAYAKVVKLDAAPLVAMIEVNPVAGHETAQPLRREKKTTTFSESRFPTLTERSSKPAGWVMGAAVVAVVVAAVGAYQAGLFPALPQSQKDVAPAASAPATPAVETVAKPGADTAPLISPNVPLVSVPPADATPGAASTTATTPAGVTPPAGPAAGTGAPAAAGATPPAAAPAGAAPATNAAAALPPAATPAPAASATPGFTPGTLVLKFNDDSWVEIRRPGKPALIARLVKAGSTEQFELSDPALLIVGKPNNVQATMRGAPLALPEVPGGTIARVNIK
ncbi:helix-turn-helix domain-containing protein [Pseudoduganella sp. LjRoot289]|uniref:helix-turn-helix domain-containing protein n=1 Tax=Pseudoduganella sp. LjRoot289 TaxID=3342314 RepID=UPI003ECE58B2